MSLSTTKSIGRQPKKWTTDEDQKLREQVEAQSAYKCPFLAANIWNVKRLQDQSLYSRMPLLLPKTDMLTNWHSVGR